MYRKWCAHTYWIKSNIETYEIYTKYDSYVLCDFLSTGMNVANGLKAVSTSRKKPMFGKKKKQINKLSSHAMSPAFIFQNMGQKLALVSWGSVAQRAWNKSSNNSLRRGRAVVRPNDSLALCTREHKHVAGSLFIELF